MTIEISKGGTLKPANERTVVRTCQYHGDYLVHCAEHGRCADCGRIGEFKGYTPDSVKPSADGAK